MRKRLLSILMVTVVTISLLSGCGKSGNDTKGTKTTVNNSTSTESKAQTAGETAQAGSQKYDDVRLKMLICWNGGFKTASDQYNNEVAAAIREKIGVTIEFEGIMMSETEKLNLLFASGDMPDIINAPYWGGDTGETQVIKKAAVEGRLLPLEDLLPEYSNLKDAYNVGVSQSFLENDLEDPDFEGHRYILPQGVPGSDADVTNWTYGVFVRGDVPKALNIDPKTIKTSDQLYDFMVKARDHGFKDVNGNDCIVATTYHNGWDYGQYAQNFNNKKFTDYIKTADGSYTYTCLTDQWVNKNLFVWKLVNNKLLDKECFRQSDSQADEKVGNGTALFAAAQYGPVIKSTKLTGLYNSNPDMRYIPVGPLDYSDGSPAKQLELNGANGCGVNIFPTTCSNIDAALTYFNYINSEEGARLSQYGIEGETYAMNDKNQPRLNADILKRKQSGDTSVDDELRNQGINYIYGRLSQINKSVTWFGEGNPGDADAAAPEAVEYAKERPVERFEGYLLTGLVSQYPDYNTVKHFAFEGTTKDDYIQRAFFAETEEAARGILEDYQNYLLTQENGIFKDYLVFVNEVANTRDDLLD